MPQFALHTIALEVDWSQHARALRGVVPLVTSRNGRLDHRRCESKTMKNRKASASSEPGPRLQSVNRYLEENFPDFFAEARFHVGSDDYFLYSRFGQYLTRSI